MRPLFPLTQQFQNKNGSNLVGGKVYIYYQGRTALATTYHDEEGTVVNSNPVLLDNNGRATVFADTIYSYTIVVCDYYGKELFSQDITLHDAISTAEDVIVMGSDGSVKADTTTLPNGVQYDMSVNTDIIATKESVDGVKNDLNTLTGKVDNHTTQIGQIQEDINGIDSALANKKDKQNELNFNGSAIKTVKSITQNANGELNVEFEDINYPGYTISSTDGSINVSISEGVTDLTLPSDVVRDSAYTHIDAATEVPLMDGIASAGVSTKYAREDHVHPSDTSREDIANKTTVILGTSDRKYPTDKAVAEFVNSSIATNTANYISNNGEPFTSVEQLEAYSGTVTNNDYAFVTGTDSEGNTYYDRYKATVKGSSVTWALEYRLNNSSFTAAQWSAINSGITSVLVSKIHEHSNKDVLDGITSTDVANWNSKMDRQTVGNVSEPVYLENGIAKIATNVATKTETEEAISNSVDQTYSPTSTKAQSGVAVNEAFKTRETSFSDDSYTYLGMSRKGTLTEKLYWKLVSFKPTNDYWSLQFEIDVSNGNKGEHQSYDSNIYETKRLTIFGSTKDSVKKGTELRYTSQSDIESRGYGNNIYYEMDSSKTVTIYIYAARKTNETQICRLTSLRNSYGINNITWYEPVVDAGTQPTNPIKFNEAFPSIASKTSDIGRDSVPVYINKGKPVSCDSSNLKAGKDDNGNVIKNTYATKTELDSRVPSPTSTTGTQVLKCINGVIQWVTE